MVDYSDNEKLRRAKVFFDKYTTIKSKSRYNRLDNDPDELILLEIFISTPLFYINIEIFGLERLKSYNYFYPEPYYVRSLGQLLFNLFMESRDLKELAYRVNDIFISDVLEINIHDNGIVYYDIVSDETKGEYYVE